MAMPRNENIKPPSVKNRVDETIKMLMQMELDAPGYDDETDAEIWDWVDYDQLPALQEKINDAIQNLQGLQYRLVQKSFEYHQNI